MVEMRTQFVLAMTFGLMYKMVSTPIVNDNLDLQNLIGMEAYIIIEN